MLSDGVSSDMRQVERRKSLRNDTEERIGQKRRPSTGRHMTRNDGGHCDQRDDIESNPRTKPTAHKQDRRHASEKKDGQSTPWALRIRNKGVANKRPKTQKNSTTPTKTRSTTPSKKEKTPTTNQGKKGSTFNFKHAAEIVRGRTLHSSRSKSRDGTPKRKLRTLSLDKGTRKTSASPKPGRGKQSPTQVPKQKPGTKTPPVEKIQIKSVPPNTVRPENAHRPSPICLPLPPQSAPVTPASKNVSAFHLPSCQPEEISNNNQKPRWPRMPNFRRKKNEQEDPLAIDDDDDDDSLKRLLLDPKQQQSLLNAMLGHSGSMFEERSTLAAPNGGVMRTTTEFGSQKSDCWQACRAFHLWSCFDDSNTSPIQRKTHKAPKFWSRKSFGEYLVDISAYPYAFIEIICCIPDDFNSTPREHSHTITTHHVNKHHQGSTPPVRRVRIVPSKNHPSRKPKNVSLARDDPSVSVFTMGTLASNAGFWLPWGLGHCGDSMEDEPDEQFDTRAENDTTTGSTSSEETPLPPVTATDFQQLLRGDDIQSDERDGPVAEPIGEFEDTMETEKLPEEATSCQAEEEASEDVELNSHKEMTRTFHSSGSAHSTGWQTPDRNYDEDEEREGVCEAPIELDEGDDDHTRNSEGNHSSNSNDSHSRISLTSDTLQQDWETVPAKPLEEWEAMEALLQRVLRQKKATDDGSVNSL